MKKVNIFLFGLIFSVSAFSQDRNNEIRFNLVNAVVGSVDLQYERILNQSSGIGLNIGVGYGEVTPFNSVVKFDPVYRAYFGKQRAAGFFIEANSRISYDKYEYYRTGNPSVNKNEVNVGLGVGLGGKFVALNGFTGTFMGGLGRFLSQNRRYGGKIYPLMEISLGKRF